jgi:Helix-turn-helix
MPRRKELTDPKQVELGRRIKEERERQGLTQEKLADAINVTKQQLSKYEACKDPGGRQIPYSGVRIPCSGSNSALKFPARLRREFCKKTTQYQRFRHTPFA